MLIIISSLVGGGAEKVLIEYLKRFDRTKFTVDLCLVVKQGVYLSEVPQDVKILSLYESASLYPFRVEHLLSREMHIDYFQRVRARRVVSQQYDVVLSFIEGLSLKFHQHLLDRAPKHISWVHIDLFVDHYTKMFFSKFADEQAIYQKMDTIVSVGVDTQKQFMKRFDTSARQMVILNPIDRQDINEQADLSKVKKSRFTISAVGRLAPQKAFDRLVRVSHRLVSEGYDFEVWIVGTGELESQLTTQIAELKLQDCVKLLGFQKPPYSFVKASDLFVSTSLAEGFSLVLCEALSLGVPVVSTRTAGPTEILDNSKYGVLCDHDDESIYQAIKSMMDSPEQLAHYRKMAQERGAMFDIDATMQQFEQLLSE